MKKSDEELMRILEIDKSTLNRFKQIRENAIKESIKINKKSKKVLQKKKKLEKKRKKKFLIFI